MKIRKTNGDNVPADADVPRERNKQNNSTAFALYLRDMGQTPLLTREEEVNLAKRIKRGDEKAREQMIKANLRLVIKIAQDYTGLGLDFGDLVNEGNIGLMKAVEKFNPAKGGKMSTYGSFWIKQSIRRAITNQSLCGYLPILWTKSSKCNG